MNDYPCLYCGGHPRLGAPEPTEATVTVRHEGFVIRVGDGQIRIPLETVSGIDEQVISGKEHLRSSVTIVIGEADGVCGPGFKIALLFTNGCFAKALALRLRLATRPIH